MRMTAAVDLSVPDGYCGCGCGARAPIADRTWRAKGWVKGEPLRYVHGHNAVANRGPRWIVDGETGCWIWQRHIDYLGYGRTRNRPAHRVVYEEYRDAIPAGLSLDHLCRNRACVNPDHLEPVTHTENCRRGRRAKLTFEIAEEIRASDESGVALAALYGVSPSAIWRIRHGLMWKP